MSLSFIESPLTVLRRDYKGAGYQMLASFDAKKSATVSLRHALYLVGICGVMPLTGMVDW